MLRPSVLLLVAFACILAGCARSRDPLPGDSVAADGGVTLSPPRLSTSPYEAREAREPLGAIEERLFPPELVMEHQVELAITPAQKDRLLAEVSEGQATMVRLQWDLQGAKERLVAALGATHVDERAATAAADVVLEHEAKVKRAHLAMLVRVKNILSAEQQGQLRTLREIARTRVPPSAPVAPSLQGGLAPTATPGASTPTVSPAVPTVTTGAPPPPPTPPPSTARRAPRPPPPPPSPTADPIF